MANELKETVSLAFRCPADLAARLEEAKWTWRKSKTAVIVEALEAHLDALEGKRPRRPAKK